MRIRLDISFENYLKMPYRYLERLRTFVLSLLGDEYANEMYSYEKYKPLVYSQIIGKSLPYSAGLLFVPNVHIYIASILDKYIERIEKNVKYSWSQILMDKNVEIYNYEIFDRPIANNNFFSTLSPICANTQITMPNGKLRELYLSPNDTTWEAVISANLQKKVKFFTGKDISDNFRIKLMDRNAKSSLLFYKGVGIKGYRGRFKFEGNNEILNYALDTGLGIHNAIGFGFINQ